MPPGPDFSVETTTDADAATVRVVGDVDMATIGAVRDALTEAIAARRTVRVDLAAVTFLGSEGIRALVDAEEAAARRAADLAVVATSPIVRRVLEIGRLEHLLRTG